jgi:hypothetical protein
MELLKPERTFAEKLLGLHVEMSKGLEGAQRVRTRHYYDVAQLFTRSADVRTSVESGTFDAFVHEAAVVSNRYWGAGLNPEAIDLRESPALRPTAAQAALLTRQYDNPLERALYYRERPSFPAMLQIMGAIADRLAANPHRRA